MRKPLVVGNWKLNGSRSMLTSLIQNIRENRDQAGATELAVCPPVVYLPLAQELLAGSDIGLGAQNCATAESGAYTGEVAAPMLAEFGCRFVLLGHSERRTLYGESDQDVVAKLAQVLAAGLQPIVCLGETLEQRDAGQTLAVVGAQLEAVLAAYSTSELATLCLAYEPVWAIGTGRTATPEQAQEVHAALRGQVASKDAELAQGLRILYGGSVKAGNASELLGQADIDGGLIGGASLNGEEFIAIGAAAPV